jgi:hypothetical protein
LDFLCGHIGGEIYSARPVIQLNWAPRNKPMLLRRTRQMIIMIAGESILFRTMPPPILCVDSCANYARCGGAHGYLQLIRSSNMRMTGCFLKEGKI